jgi:beta-phosphoglucomutase-like phosphatase (HAD superfamily)
MSEDLSLNDECLVVEDSIVGVEAAIAARMPVVAYA